ncbi:hypothetical protein B0H63DRAFT_447732 [Podospora didyma]|uniref:F-box domain-containing protein n=1 Tax=Podospora didyma TaxID=330526 RepID=A0AAE0U175_9PEZI|nr:hypothetical protein B0H63DRAFT_447732 [Podospora didyma]
MATDAVQLSFKFLSLPGELRNKIYRLVLRRKAVIGTSSVVERFKLSGQLLRTCRQIHDEGLSILYSENTFEIDIFNTEGLYGQTIYWLDALIRDLLYGDSTNHVRRLRIQVRYTEDHMLEPLRKTVRWLVRHLQELPSPGIEFLQLECKLDCENENEEIDWEDYDYEDFDGNKEECIGVLQTWLGRLRNVKEVIIEGDMPDEDANILQERLHTRTTRSEQMGEQPLADGEGKEEKETRATRALALTDLYEALERHVCGIRFCEYDVNRALLAVERDDADAFKAYRTAIIQRIRQRGEELMNDEVLQD